MLSDDGAHVLDAGGRLNLGLLRLLLTLLLVERPAPDGVAQPPEAHLSPPLLVHQCLHCLLEGLEDFEKFSQLCDGGIVRCVLGVARVNYDYDAFATADVNLFAVFEVTIPLNKFEADLVEWRSALFTS